MTRDKVLLLSLLRDAREEARRARADFMACGSPRAAKQYVRLEKRVARLLGHLAACPDPDPGAGESPVFVGASAVCGDFAEASR